jgi:hypothetical protein
MNNNLFSGLRSDLILSATGDIWQMGERPRKIAYLSPIYDDDAHVGHLLATGKGVNAYDKNGDDLGLFSSASEAMRGLLEAHRAPQISPEVQEG